MISTAERHIREYTAQEVAWILEEEGVTPEDKTYFSAVYVDPLVIPEGAPGSGAYNMPTRSVVVYEVQDYPTGFCHALGTSRVILVNVMDTLHYDLISELHQSKDAHIYLWLTEKFEGDKDFDVLNEWYRDETYPDTYKEED